MRPSRARTPRGAESRSGHASTPSEPTFLARPGAGSQPAAPRWLPHAPLADRRFSMLPGADPYRVADRQDEHLAVADLARTRGADNRRHRLVHHGVRNDSLDLDL